MLCCMLLAVDLPAEVALVVAVVVSFCCEFETFRLVEMVLFFAVRIVVVFVSADVVIR